MLYRPTTRRYWRFLSRKDPDWLYTQTIPPDNLTAYPELTPVGFEWQPIPFQWSPGRYEIFYSETSGGPYIYYGETSSKNDSIFLLENNLQENTTYYFVIQTISDPHISNQNTVESDLSEEILITTLEWLDTDGDGLHDAFEEFSCTDPYDADTDDDGIADGDEDPHALNQQLDALILDPCNNDSDFDGLQDGTELGYTYLDVTTDTNLDLFQPDLDPTTTTDPLSFDSDGDGWSDGKEDYNLNGRVDIGEGDPLDSQIMPVTSYADLDLDFDVDGMDLATFSWYYNNPVCEWWPCSSDFDQDGDVDIYDLELFIAEFGEINCNIQ